MSSVSWWIAVIPFVIVVGIILFIALKPHGPPHPKIKDIKEQLKKINPKFSQIPMREGKSAYTENKSIVFLCLKDPKTGEYYDMNTLMYVTLHELAHVVSKGYGHGQEWKNNFTKLLNQAHRSGIYDPSQPIVKNYCGIKS